MPPSPILFLKLKPLHYRQPLNPKPNYSKPWVAKLTSRIMGLSKFIISTVPRPELNKLSKVGV